MKMFLYIFSCLFLWLHFVSGTYLRSDGEGESNTTAFKYRIAGGEPVALDIFPFNVQFFNMGGMCGGSILTKKTVLTAAHCLEFNKKVAEMKVFSNSRFIHDLKASAHGVWSFKAHEKYNSKVTFANDIAVLIIVDEFVFNPLVQIASLSNSEVWMRENETFYVSGWGETKYGAGLTNQELMSTYLSYVPKKRCEKMTGTKLSPDMFCLFGDGKRDTCRGDSGGGVVWHNMLVGIVSHGEGCVKKPSMYVNVSRMRSWIQNAVHQLYDKFCTKYNRQRNSL